MTGVLLGRVALQKMIVGDTQLQAWQATREPTELLYTTFVNVAELLAMAEANPKVEQRRRWVERLTQDVPAQFGPRLLPFELKAAKSWSAMRVQLDTAKGWSDPELQTAAIAAAEQLTYVAPGAPWLDQLSELDHADPWA